MGVIGISSYYHDSAAALISSSGEIICAVQEERFTRKKHDSRFPYCSLDYCLKKARESGETIEAYVYYEKPIRVFMRLLETYFNTAPRGFSSFLPAMQSWIKDKLFINEKLIEDISMLDPQFNYKKLFFSEHHLSHASSAFYPSPFKESVVLCLDAVGEWVTTSAWMGKDRDLHQLWDINFPHSLGMLYSSFTYYCGFKVNSGEYKLMGLAPYGKPIYRQKILSNLLDLKEDGSFRLNMKYFKFHRGLRMISSEFIQLFSRPPRKPEDTITQFYMDIAASIQSVLETVLLRITQNLYLQTKHSNLCLSGGVALNCVANEKIIQESGFKNVWIQPASGDSGSALGAALSYLYNQTSSERIIEYSDSMKSSYLGPEFSELQITNFLDKINVKYEKFSISDICKTTASDLEKGKIVGWFQGRMEYGPRALGNRSILADPRVGDMQRRMNLKIKFRESFRPFAPAILEELMGEYFNLKSESPYMLITKKIAEKFIVTNPINGPTDEGVDRVNQIRSELPAITHLDYSCRVQTVSKDRNPIFHELINQFYKITGCPAIINTSFNVRGEPIVCTPYDALACFANTNIDVLVINNIKIHKEDCIPSFSEYFLKPQVIED